MNTPPPSPLHTPPPPGQHFVALAVQGRKGEGCRGGLLVAHCKCSLEFVTNKVKWQRAATIFHTHTTLRRNWRREGMGEGKAREGRAEESARKASKAAAAAEKIGNLTFDVFYETCSNNILGNLF